MNSLLKAAGGVLALVVGCQANGPAGRPDPLAARPSATRPATAAAEEDVVPLRQVEVTLLGTIASIKGMPPWPEPADRWPSHGVEEPCELTVHLPSGKSLTIRTRPILVVSRKDDLVVTVRVPPLDSEDSWMADQARRMEKLMELWGAVPSPRMRARIEELKQLPPPTPDGLLPLGGITRLGVARLDDQTELDFVLVMGEQGRWNLTSVISGHQ